MRIVGTLIMQISIFMVSTGTAYHVDLPSLETVELGKLAFFWSVFTVFDSIYFSYLLSRSSQSPENSSWKPIATRKIQR